MFRGGSITLPVIKVDMSAVETYVIQHKLPSSDSPSISDQHTSVAASESCFRCTCEAEQQACHFQWMVHGPTQYLALL